MIVCAKCGSPNRSSARFCAKCAAPLTTSSVSAEDEAWLADSLSKDLPAGTDFRHAVILILPPPCNGV